MALKFSYTVSAIAISAALSLTACNSSSDGGASDVESIDVETINESGVDVGTDDGSSSNVDAVVDSSDSACVDVAPVGDGWGWDGTQSCVLGDTSDGSTASAGIDTNTSSIDAARINLLGLLKLDPDSDEADFATALFGQLPSTFTGEQLRNFYAPTTDNCRVTTIDPNATDEPQLNVFDDRLNLLSAGETLVLTSGDGTFATLTSSPGTVGPVYQTNIALNVDRPNGLTVDIPGEVFPEFSGVPIADVPGLQITSPSTGQNVDASTSFTWNGSNAQQSIVEVYTIGIGANGQEILVGCSLVDDGSFTFPESVRAQMGDNFDDTFTAYLRIVYNVARNGEALLVTANSVFGIQQ